MIPGLPAWANVSIILILVIAVSVLAILQINFFDKWDNRIKITDQRYEQQKAADAAEKAADASRTRKVDILVNETRGTIADLLYLVEIRLGNHTIHTDRELGDLNGNLTKLIKLNYDIANASLTNQELYFKPYLNRTFTEILDAIKSK